MTTTEHLPGISRRTLIGAAAAGAAASGFS